MQITKQISQYIPYLAVTVILSITFYLNYNPPQALSVPNPTSLGVIEVVNSTNIILTESGSQTPTEEDEENATPTPSPTPTIIGRGFDHLPDEVEDCVNDYSDKSDKLTDVESDTFEGYILSLNCREVINGFSDNTYRSSENVTRSALAKYIVNAFEITVDTSGDNFGDVGNDNEFYNYIMSLKNKEIISGFSDGTFKPDESVRRQEVTKFIVEALVYNEVEVDLDNIVDFPDIDLENKFKGYIGFLSNVEYEGENIISGFSDNTFKPDTYVTRGQMAKMVENSIRYMNQYLENLDEEI